MNHSGQYQLVFGDSSKMDILRTGEVDLVLTGPPYFSDTTEELLREPFRKQKDIERAKREVSAFAIGLRPVYDEIRRVLRPGGYLVTQTKDLCYGGIFISLTALHREMAEATGLHLLSHIYWHKFKRNSDSKRFLDNPLAGAFRNDYVEDICIFSDQPYDPKPHALVELSPEELQKSVSPLWVVGPASKNREHPHKTPKALVRRLIARGIPARRARPLDLFPAAAGADGRCSATVETVTPGDGAHEGVVLLQLTAPDSLATMWSEVHQLGIRVSSLKASCRPFEEVFLEALQAAQALPTESLHAAP
jgi:hypothetical protein